MLEDTQEEIHQVGHRRFVGGSDDYWDVIGELQFRLLRDRGLTPSDTLVDVGCGALRGGARFIRYLEPGHYLGIEKHIELVIYGVASELGIEEYRERRPRFVISDSFKFQGFSARPSFGIAQSLFSHLSAHDVELCLSQLKGVASPGCKLFATFFEVNAPVVNPTVSHSHDCFSYTRSQMEEFGVRTGWEPRYVGEWNHPRAQRLIEYIALAS